MMTGAEIAQILGAAKDLTVTGLAFLGLWLLMTGRLVTALRLQEWKDHAAFWRDEANKNRDAILVITNDMDKLIRAVEPLGPALKELAQDHEETDRCISAITRRVEQWEAEWRAVRKTQS